MSTISELPDESWSEEKILELLDENIGPSAQKEVRVVCLDVLRRRDIQRIDEAMDVLLKSAEYHGRSTPESSMIVELISRLANAEESAFKKLLSRMIRLQDNLMYCFARIIRNLEDPKKGECMPRLLEFLMGYDSFTNITGEMFQTLVTADNEDINKNIVKATLPYIRVADPYKVVYAVKIISRLGSAEVLSKLELIIERALTGWFNGHKEEILTNICSYLGRIKDERSTPRLLQIIKSGFNRERIASKALARVVDAHPEVMDEIWDFLQKEKELYFPILMVLEEMKTSVDVERLFSIADIELGIQSVRQTSRKIIKKAGQQAKPLLLSMIKDKHYVRYTFALNCLEEIGVSIEEYSRVFEKHPILQIHEFFYNQRKGMLLENLWKEQDELGKSIKKSQIRRFEYFVQNLFSVLGFVTLFVDPSGKEGVDLIAFSPNEPYILVIGCTTSILKDDLQKMKMTITEMIDALKELFAKYRILPTVFTSRKVDVTPADSEYAGKNSIAILTQEEITTLLKMLRTNRRSDEIIKHIKQSIPPFSINP